MAADRYTTEFHLTPTGWQSGNSTFFGKPQGETVEPPEDRVETWIHSVFQASEWSNEEHSWQLDWESNEASKARGARAPGQVGAAGRSRLCRKDVERGRGSSWLMRVPER